MSNTTTLQASTINSLQEGISLEKIPDDIYNDMVTSFSEKYSFENGARMRISNYYVKISRSLSNEFKAFIDEMTDLLTDGEFPSIEAPNGFNPPSENMIPTEREGGFSFGSFDMAVTEEQLQNIEFQAIATYPISAAQLNQQLFDRLAPQNASTFVGNKETTFQDLIDLYKAIIAGDKTTGLVITDRKILEQKTKFEFYATQKELDIPIKMVDSDSIYEKEGSLYYIDTLTNKPVQITRMYSRILLAEALFEDNYPTETENWKFRFDIPYNDLTYVNHPIRQFDFSKRLSPYINHPFNPECYELAEVENDFKSGKLAYEDFIWKHKWGAAGHRLILNPNETILSKLQDQEDYIAQRKVKFKVFKTEDGLEKIIELRFMTAHHNGKMIIVPMARIGNMTTNEHGETDFKIHFADNNMPGYGFSAVIIEEDEI